MVPKMLDQEYMDDIKHTLDATSLGVAVATLANWLPAVAALFTIIWTGIRIWESDTIRRLTGRGR